MTSWHNGDVTDDDVAHYDVTSDDVTAVGQCALCVSEESHADCSLVIGSSSSLQHQRHHQPGAMLCSYACLRPGPAAIDQHVSVPVPVSRGRACTGDVPSVSCSSTRVVNCQSAVSNASLYYDVVARPMYNHTPAAQSSSTLYSQVSGVSRPSASAPSTAAFVHPYCHLDDNVDNTPGLDIPTTGLDISTPGTATSRVSQQQIPEVRTTRVGRSAVYQSAGCYSASLSTRPHYDIQILDNHNYTTRTRDAVRRLAAGAKSTPRNYLSKSCPNIRLASDPQHSPHAAMSTFGKSRPAMRYNCTTEDCSCSLELELEKLFGFKNSVYFGGQDVDLFNGNDATAGRRRSSQQTSQYSYGAVAGTTHGSRSAAAVRAFLSSDASRKHSDRVACETTRLNSAVCKPIITTRHHKVSLTLYIVSFRFIASTSRVKQRQT